MQLLRPGQEHSRQRENECKGPEASPGVSGASAERTRSMELERDKACPRAVWALTESLFLVREP